MVDGEHTHCNQFVDEKGEDVLATAFPGHDVWQVVLLAND